MSDTRLLIHRIKDVTIVDFQDASILDAAQVESIGEELYELVDSQARKRIVLDFTKVQFLSSSALGVLINLRKKSAEIKGRIVLCGIRKDLMKVFEITNLTKVFTFAPTEDKALACFG